MYRGCKLAKKAVSKKSASAKSTKAAAKKTVKKVAEKTAKKVAKKAVKKTTRAKATSASNAAKKPAVKVAQKAAKKTTVKNAVKKPAAKVAKKTTAKVAKKTTVKKVKSPLTKSQLAKFREMLLEKRRGLIGDMNGIQAEALRMGIEGGGTDLSTIPTHPADMGSDNYEQEFSLGLLESERALLEEINEALERIEEGSYGICAGTGKPIGIPRLTARPWAKYGIEYARMLEKGITPPLDEEEDFEY